MARRTHLLAAMAIAIAGCDATESGVSALAAGVDGGATTTTTTATVPTVPTATPFPDAGGGSSAPLADAGVAKRTLRWENPLGGPAGNLFVDGDVELSVGATGQMGLLAFDTGGAGQVAFAAETGGLCKSGLHCAVLTRKTILFFRGVATARGQGSLVRLAVKPPADDACDAVSAVLVSCDTQAVVKKLAAPLDRDADGWCEHGASVPPRDYGLCLMVKSSLAIDRVALVDAARLVPDDGTVSPRAGEIWVPDAETARQLEDIGDRIRRTMPFGRAPGPARDVGP